MLQTYFKYFMTLSWEYLMTQVNGWNWSNVRHNEGVGGNYFGTQSTSSPLRVSPLRQRVHGLCIKGLKGQFSKLRTVFTLSYKIVSFMIYFCSALGIPFKEIIYHILLIVRLEYSSSVYCYNFFIFLFIVTYFIVC